uniref:Uncharacterized protein n=1 Tax=Brassica oleracea TaxID=3712 RepID=A0A3P6E3W0_BRAOL|nr:unnamed protein product [Brassica oleracea]
MFNNSLNMIWSQTRKLLKPSLRLTLSMAKDVSSDPFLFALYGT